MAYSAYSGKIPDLQKFAKRVYKNLKKVDNFEGSKDATNTASGAKTTEELIVT